MNSPVRRTRNLLAISTTLAFTPLLLGAPAAHAASPYDPLTNFFSDNSAGSVSDGCVESDSSHSATPSQPLVANAAPVNATATAAITATAAPADPADSVTASASVTGKAQIRAAGGRPTSMDVALHATSTSTSTNATSACTASLLPDLIIVARFTLDRPTVMTVDAEGHGIGGYAWTSTSGSDIDFDPSPGGTQGVSLGRTPRSHTTVYLAPGTYTGIFAGVATVAASSPTHRTGSAKIHVAFAAAGTRTSASGSATYVKLPTSRACSTHRLNARITKKAKADKRIKSVVFQLNGKTVKKVKHPARGTTVALKPTDDAPVTVTAKAKLKNGKAVTTRAHYLECS